MNRDELEGKAGALKGKIKQAAVGRTKRKVGDAIEHVGKGIKN